MVRYKKLVTFLGLEAIAFYLLHRTEINPVPKDIVPVMISQVLATLFALVFLLAQITGKLVRGMYRQDIYKTYPLRHYFTTYFIAFVFTLGIVLPMVEMIFGFPILKACFFLFITCFVLLLLHLDFFLGKLSFSHNLKTLKEEFIFAMSLSREEDYRSWIEFVRTKSRQTIGKLYGKVGGTMLYLRRIHSAIAMLPEIEEYQIPSCIEDIFGIIEFLLKNNQLEYCEQLLDDMIKTSSVSEKYTIKKSTIQELTIMNSRIQLQE